MSKLNKTPQEFKEIFEWYAEWILTECTTPHDEIFWLCDMSKNPVIRDIVDIYESLNTSKV